MFHDQPMKPLDKAVYWIEYIIRHNGAHHLKTAANKLNWIQFLSIDIMFMILIVLLIFLNIVMYIVKKMYRFYIKHSESNKDNDKKLK